MLDPDNAIDILERITFIIRIEKNAKGNWEHGTGFFISGDGYALTAFHCLSASVRQAGHGTVDVYYKGNWHKLECHVSISLPEEEGDVAILQWLTPPHGHIDFVPVAYFDPNPAISERERRRFWSGRGVCIYGFPCEGAGFGDRPVWGYTPSLPFTRLTQFEGAGEIKRGVELLRVVSDEPYNLKGISGAPILDLKTGWVIGVENACREEPPIIYGTEIAQLLKKWQGLPAYAKVLDIAD